MRAPENSWNWYTEWHIYLFHILQIKCSVSAIFSTAWWELGAGGGGNGECSVVHKYISCVVFLMTQEQWVPALPTNSLTAQSKRECGLSVLDIAEQQLIIWLSSFHSYWNHSQLGSHGITSLLRPSVFFYKQCVRARLYLNNNLTPPIIPSVFIYNPICHNHLYSTFYFIGKCFGDPERKKKIMICVNCILKMYSYIAWKQLRFLQDLLQELVQETAALISARPLE